MKEEELKEGYTTGTCATSALKAALTSLIDGINLPNVGIITLNNTELEIPIFKIKTRKNVSTAVVKKFSGDDPDVTSGISICVRVDMVDELPVIERGLYYDKFVIVGGRGVGVVTKKGLQVQVGKSAINPGPQKMMKSVIEEFLVDTNKKIVVTVYVPEGIAKSKQTLNSKLGVIGGISILGTTGIVKPMSETALKKSLYAELKVLRLDREKDFVIFAFGNYGLECCKQLGLDREQVVLTSNFVGFMIESAVKLEFKKILMIGHIGKVIKIAGGIFNTHSRVADARMEIFGANAFLVGEKDENVRKILNANTAEEACEYVEKEDFFPFIANKIKHKVEEYSRSDDIVCETLIFAFQEKILGTSTDFYKMVGELVEEN